ncbi:DUF998 domain-containing protein [Streptomyces sp. NBC_00490]|uniref:DUF998 domain-containing protein n=1 Tax=Streptomyces sp. NBC_00490 TaxID=2903657 RepID=UPI0030DFDC97
MARGAAAPRRLPHGSGEWLPTRHPRSASAPHPCRALHDLFSLIGFLALAVACLFFALSNSPVGALYLVASGVLFATTMALASAAFSQHQRWVDRGGLIQRASLTIGWTWQTLLAVRTLHTRRSSHCSRHG